MMPLCQTIQPVATGAGKLGNPMRLLPTPDGFIWQIYAGGTIDRWIECGPGEDFETPDAAKRWLVAEGGMLS